jgi:hypothetical protein
MHTLKLRGLNLLFLSLSIRKPLHFQIVELYSKLSILATELWGD